MNFQDLRERVDTHDRSAAALRAIAAARFERPAAVPFRQRWGRIRRAWLGLAVWTLICGGLAWTYCLLATPKFLVSTSVVLEPRQSASSSDPAATAVTLDSALADSQVQVLTSERNLHYVFDVQHLESDPEFTKSSVNPIGWVLSWFSSPVEPVLPAAELLRHRRQVAYDRFASQVSARRVAQSYAFELSFFADSAAKAVKIGNAITAAYIRDKLLYNIAAAAAQRGGDFLQNRVADTKAEQDAADEAVKTGVIPNFVFGHADARIVSSAIEPEAKAYPKTSFSVAAAVAFALISGVAVVIVMDELDRRVRSARRLQGLTGLTALACVPAVRKRREALLKLALLSPNSRFAAELRKLRVAAADIAQSVVSPSIGVLSYRRGEGRSTIAANLAALMAELGGPVALVDGDVANPALTRTFAPGAKRGLADTALVEADRESLLVKVANNLLVLPARALGFQPDPNRIAAFSATTAACAILARSGLVVVDLPPVSESPEGVAAARGLAGVFLVVDAKSVTVEEFLELLDRLVENDVRVLGVVLNKAEDF